MKRRPLHVHAGLVALLAVAFLLVAAPFLWSGSWNLLAFRGSMNDQAGYVSTAMHLAADGSYESSVYYPGLLPYLGSHNVPYLPGAYYLRAAFFRALGVSVFSAMLPALLAFVGTVVLAFLIGARLSGPRAGWLFALFVAAYPPFLMYAYSAMNEMIVVGLCLGAVLAFLAAPRSARAPLAGALLVLPALVREDAYLMLPGLALLLALEDRTHRAARVAILGGSAALAALAIGALPAVADRPPTYLMHVVDPKAIFYDATAPPVGDSSLAVIGAAAGNLGENLRQLVGALEQGVRMPFHAVFLLVPLLLTVGLGALTPLVPPRRRPWHVFAIACGFTGFLATASIAGYLVEWSGVRRTLFAVPPLLGALAVLLAESPRRRLAGAATGTLLAALGAGLAAFLPYARAEHAWAGEHERECRAVLDAVGAEGAQGFVAPFWLSLDYVLRHWPVRWSFPPNNEESLALVARSMPVDLLVASDTDPLVRDPRSGMPRWSLLGGDLRLEGEIFFVSKQRTEEGVTGEPHRLLVYRGAAPD